LLPKIHDAIVNLLPQMLARWSNNQLFKPHIDLLSHAAEEFREGDYVSAVAIMYPRIEGLLRSVHQSLGVEERATQRALTGRLIEARKGDSHGFSWLLPEMFQKYLDEAYFAHFEPGKPARMSRNSVGHGVADAADFNQKAACIGFLVLDQLFYFLPNQAA
jgi:hypothetical protein